MGGRGLAGWGRGVGYCGQGFGAARSAGSILLIYVLTLLIFYGIIVVFNEEFEEYGGE
jgi:hypothetical protein